MDWTSSNFRRRLCLAGGLSWLAPCASAAGRRIPVRVISEPWETLIEADAAQRPIGAIAEFVLRMNAVQSRFDFRLQIVPRLRVNRMFIEGEADLYPLRTLDWVEPELKLLASRPLVQTGDVYIARRDNAVGGARIFEQLATRSLVGVRGYHYGLFGNNSDERFIRKHYRAELLPTNAAVVRFVELGRAEVGIVPEAMVAKILQDPQRRANLIVADRYDSRVELSHLVRQGGPIGVEMLNELLEPLFQAGDVAHLQRQMQIPAAWRGAAGLKASGGAGHGGAAAPRSPASA